jgi:hypothetical protein
MKNVVLVTICLSCQNESNSIDPKVNVSNICTPGVENGYLSFNTYQSFVSLMNTVNNTGFNLVDNWQILEGFTSMYEYNYSLTTRTGKSVNSKVELKRTINPFFEKILNKDGLVKVGKTLYQFGSDELIAVPNFKGTTIEVANFLKSDQKQKDYVVVPYSAIDLKKTDAGNRAARLEYSWFTMTSTGNTIVNYVGGEGVVYGAIRGKLTGTCVQLPIFCYRNDDPAMTDYYVCDYYSYWNIVASASYPNSTQNEISAYATISYSTERGSGSQAGNTNFDKVIYFGDDFRGFSGYVDFRCEVTPTGYGPYISTATITF